MKQLRTVFALWVFVSETMFNDIKLTLLLMGFCSLAFLITGVIFLSFGSDWTSNGITLVSVAAVVTFCLIVIWFFAK